MRWLDRAVRSWSRRSGVQEADQSDNPPMLMFPHRSGQKLRGSIAWCRRWGGVPLNRREKVLLRWAFRFRRARRRKRDLPTSDQIVEGLTSKVLAEIDRRAPVAFEEALDEMIGHHHFVLAWNASHSPDGTPANFADHSNNPLGIWSGQYGRLFGRATDRIGDDDSFIHHLTRVPYRLLLFDGGYGLSHPIVEAILDLYGGLAYQLQAWVTRRTVADTLPGESATPRLTLAGSDAKAYGRVVDDVLGAWESTGKCLPEIRYWRKKNNSVPDERWANYRESWPLLWPHLRNTGYAVVVAVWNEDAIGAALSGRAGALARIVRMLAG